MNQLRCLILILILPLPLLALSLQGCIEMAVVGAGAVAMSAVDRRTTGAQVEDEGIELRARNRISERWSDKVSVGVTSFNRSVLLTGTSTDAKARADIENLVKTLPNVRSVTNDIAVGGAQSAPATANDAFITGKVKARFVDSGKFSAVHVKVVTEASVVYLLGLVTESEANEAVELTRTTGGVRKVVKVFEYCKQTDAACAPSARPKATEAKK